MYTVQVLLSTYNGEEYVCQQIDSILNQEGVNVMLLVRDDGSTDGTLAILREYDSEYDNFTYTRGKNVGAAASFFRLFQISDEAADYYALADQDDVWDSDKLKTACEKLEKLSNHDIPLLYCCSSESTDENLTPLPGFQDSTAYTPDFRNAIIENIARGGSIVFNRCLMSSVRIPMPKGVYMHDWWLYLVASCFGEVCYDPQPHYKYRQHSGNVLGAAPGGFAKIKRRLKQSKTNKGHIKRQLDAFAATYRIPEDKLESANVVLKYRDSLKYRFKGFSGKYLFRQKKADNFIFRLLFFTNQL